MRRLRFKESKLLASMGLATEWLSVDDEQKDIETGLQLRSMWCQVQALSTCAFLQHVWDAGNGTKRNFYVLRILSKNLSYSAMGPTIFSLRWDSQANSRYLQSIYSGKKKNWPLALCLLTHSKILWKIKYSFSVSKNFMTWSLHLFGLTLDKDTD